jgi:predicted aspartyl protease
MPSTVCGFNDVPGGASGEDLLASYGPTLLVDIGFDPNFTAASVTMAPVTGIQGIHALVDTGASESCIDSLLATQLNLPIVDRRTVAGAHGGGDVNMHLAQVRIPSLGINLYGAFAGVHLQAGGQVHRALIGRTFLRYCKMVYEGHTGNVTIEVVQPLQPPPVPAVPTPPGT